MFHAPLLRALISCLSITLVSATSLRSQTPATSAGAGTLVRPALDPASTQADFDILRAALEEAHGGLYRFVERSHLDRRLAAHRARLDRPLSQLAFAGILAEAIAEIRDGHSRLEYDSLTNAALAVAPMLPLRVVLEGDKLVVLYNDSPVDTTARPGMEVVSINGRTVPDLLAELLPKVPGDGFIETGKRFQLARQFARYYWLFVEQEGPYVVAVRDSSARMLTATLTGIVERDRRTTANANPANAEVNANIALLDGLPGNVALEFLDEPAIARLRVRAFGGEAFPATLDSAFRVLRDRGTRALVLDLRGNGGGVDEYGALLVSHFVDRPFRYFDRIHLTTIAPSFATWLPRTFDDMRAGTVPHPAGGYRVTPALHSGVGELQPASHPFLGRMVVLTDGGTFSTAADVAAQLRSRKRAMFVGEETAGTYEGNTSALNALIVLPNSQLRLKVMMYGYWNAVVPAEPGRGIIPDHIVVRRIADILRGVDPAMERALALLR